MDPTIAVEMTIWLLQSTTVSKIEPIYLPIKIGNVSTTLLFDSGSACSVLDRSLTTRVVKSNQQAISVSEINKRQLRTFSNEPSQTKGKRRTSVASNGWHISAAEFKVVAEGLKPLICCNLSDELKLSVTQFPSKKLINKKYFNIILQFPKLITHMDG